MVPHCRRCRATAVGVPAKVGDGSQTPVRGEHARRAKGPAPGGCPSGMPAPSRLAACALAILLPVASCGGGYRPLQAAEACRCSPRQYCHVRAGAPPECLPLPAACASSPGCTCVGRPTDACREELGALTVLEPRPVTRCGECSADEYCWKQGGEPVCRVLPARCDDTPTCDCLIEARAGRVVCDRREGRLEAEPAGPSR
jgi:hypothetical protein